MKTECQNAIVTAIDKAASENGISENRSAATDRRKNVLSVSGLSLELCVDDT
jgi:hypothetical protein